MKTKYNQNLFLWFCWVCFLLLCAYGIFEHQIKGSIRLFSNNPIPAGSLLILLSVSPLMMLDSPKKWIRRGAIFSIILGIILIVMIGKRGTVLGLCGMVLVYGFTLPWKRVLLLYLALLLVFSGGYIMRNHLNPQLTKHYLSHHTTLVRAEHYLFAASIWAQKPLFGIGLHAPLTPHLKNYEPKIYKTKKYNKHAYYVRKNKTFENIILCGFVEMGSLFSIAYIVLIAIIINKIFIAVRQNLGKKAHAIKLLMPLFGFLVHSMTFDSIIFPHLNWLVHTLLALLYNFSPEST